MIHQNPKLLFKKNTKIHKVLLAKSPDPLSSSSSSSLSMASKRCNDIFTTTTCFEFKCCRAEVLVWFGKSPSWGGTSFILITYNPYCEGWKLSFFMGLGGPSPDAPPCMGVIYLQVPRFHRLCFGHPKKTCVLHLERVFWYDCRLSISGGAS